MNGDIKMKFKLELELDDRLVEEVLVAEDYTLERFCEHVQFFGAELLTMFLKDNFGRLSNDSKNTVY